MFPLKAILLILAFLPASLSVFSQNEQVLFELEELGTNVNSRYHDSAPVISPDGNTLYFFRANHPDNRYGTDNSQDIWYCERDEFGKWKQAVHMEEPLNTLRYNQVMSVLTDGNTLLIRGDGKTESGFSLTRRINGQWSRPEPLEVRNYTKLNNGRFSGACLSPDGKVLILYFNEKEQSKYSDLYVSFSEGANRWSEPKMIGNPISTNLDEFGPFIVADNKTMYFASNRGGGYGSTDIYKTERLDDTWLNWSVPLNMGKPLNTDEFDAYFSIDASGKHVFTTRAFMTADGGSLDILGLIPKPVFTLSGTVWNQKTKQPVETQVYYFAGNVDKGTFSSDTEGKYELIVREKLIYLFNIQKEGFLTLSDSINLGKYNTDTKITKDFYLTPAGAELVVYGHTREEDSFLPLGSEVIFFITDGTPLSTTSNPNDGYYTIRLPEPGNYSIKATSPGYLPLEENINIQAGTNYQEFAKDLLLSPIVELSGFVMDEKDLHPLEVTVIYEKNKQKRGEFRTNAEGYFKVTLGEKGKYVFRSQMEGYFNLSDSLEINSYNPREGKTKDFYMTPIEVGITVRLNYIYFDFDKTSLTPESTPELDRVVNFLQQNSSIQVEIAGHTDNKGSDDYNLNLSQGRAQAVVDYLTEKGIEPGRLVAKGYGEGSPVATNDTEEGRQTNRRVEVKVIEK